VANNSEGAARAFGTLAAVIALVGGMWGLLNQQELHLQRQIAPIKINQDIILNDLRRLEEKFQEHVNDGHPESLEALLRSEMRDLDQIRKSIVELQAKLSMVTGKLDSLESRKSEQ
jgi:uncharacterized protein HemX